MSTNGRRDRRRIARGGAGALIVLLGVAGLVGCATAGSAGGAATSAPPVASETSPSPLPSLETKDPGEADPDTSAETPQPQPQPQPPSETEASTRELLDACLASVRDDNPPAAQQLDRSVVLVDAARSAVRPDGDYYVVVPIDDGSVDARVEYACLLSPDLDVTSSWGRVAPDTDDFDQWATGTEPTEGL